MELRMIGTLVMLLSLVSSSEAQLTLYDPRLCYILDGFLLLYGVIITGLFIREKWAKPQRPAQDNKIYQELDKNHLDTYDKLGGVADTEAGRARGGRRRVDENSTYTGLQKRTEDVYREIPKENRRRNDHLYQGLRSGTKDTYDSLELKPLPPPPKH